MKTYIIFIILIFIIDIINHKRLKIKNNQWKFDINKEKLTLFLDILLPITLIFAFKNSIITGLINLSSKIVNFLLYLFAFKFTHITILILISSFIVSYIILNFKSIISIFKLNKKEWKVTKTIICSIIGIYLFALLYNWLLTGEADIKITLAFFSGIIGIIGVTKNIIIPNYENINKQK